MPRTRLTFIRAKALKPEPHPTEQHLPDLYADSEGLAVGLSFADFAAALSLIAYRYLAPDTSDLQRIEFYRALHLKDFALAQACSRGSVAAWEVFLSRYRSKLYAAALAITKDDRRARDVADSLSADLFAAQSSKLASYSGRGSLDAWLKAVLGHACVDIYRSGSNMVSLDERMAAIGSACLSLPPVQERNLQRNFASADSAVFQRAIEEAFSAQTAERRFLLAAYFFDGRTLAEIGRSIGAHESTVSRRLDQTLRDLRAKIKRSLSKHGMSSRQIIESLECETYDLPLDIRGLLLRGLNAVKE